MISKIWTKPQTQQAIKALRDAGLTVAKLNGGYEAKSPSGELLFKAMNGMNGYLVRYHEALFVGA